jgi:RNA polymerase sigma-70 factor (TIGR02960 family)
VSGSTQQRPRADDGRAFEELIRPHLRELHVHCYRMLGSVFDAEDLVQETIAAAWQGLDGFEGRSSARTWLYRIATNRCLNAIRDGRRRPPVEPLAPFATPARSRDSDVTWLQPYPTAWLDAESTADPARRYQDREAVNLAFVAALQRLSPRQTAALVLCDVLGFDTTEAAEILDASPVAIKGLLQRARAGIDRGRPAPPGPGVSDVRRSRDDERDRAVARRFADAYAEDDIDRLLALLTDDAWLAMSPAPHIYICHEPIGAFLRASAHWRVGQRFVLTPTSANHCPAFSYGLEDINGQGVRREGVMVLTIAGDRVATVTRFMDARLAELFAGRGRDLASRSLAMRRRSGGDWDPV